MCRGNSGASGYPGELTAPTLQALPLQVTNVTEFNQMAGGMVQNLYDSGVGSTTQSPHSPACMLARALSPVAMRLCDLLGVGSVKDEITMEQELLPVPADMVEELMALKATHYDTYLGPNGEHIQAN
jgi:hypothetical protein